MTSDILFERRGAIGLVTLNRPQALNALNLDMIRAFDPQLKAWAEDPAVQAVVVRGAGGKAFCAGGDVRAIAEEGIKARRDGGDTPLGRVFFFEEYRLNRRIFHFPKPYISLLDGITMGGGKGLSAHGSHRIVTEKLVFAMPETAIGLFPDVGGGYFLPRCPGQSGLYLALTGARLGAADALYVGFGTHYVPSAKIETLVERLERADWSSSAATVDQVVRELADDAGAPPLAEKQAQIDRCFRFDSVEEIVAALDAEGSDWARDAAATIRRMSPTSCKITLRQLRDGAGMDIEDVLVMEYRISQGCMAGHDFYEGIRAVLIDKDRDPHWRPAVLEEVTAAEVDRHFAPLGERDLTFID